MATKKHTTRYSIKFDPDIPSHQEAIKTLDEVGRSKAALIADAIRIRNIFYTRNIDMIAEMLQNNTGSMNPSQLFLEQTLESSHEKDHLPGTLPLSPETETYGASASKPSDNDFWRDISNAIDMFSE